jgi:hypothetical protein
MSVFAVAVAGEPLSKLCAVTIAVLGGRARDLLDKASCRSVVSLLQIC